MRALTSFICLMTLQLSVSGQTFEGKITYSNTFKSMIPNFSDAQLTAAMGDKWDYYIREGNYKEQSNGQLEWEIYDPASNKIYIKSSGSEKPTVQDASVNEDPVLDSKLYKNAATILGYPCDKLVLTCKSGTEEYYFSNKFPIAPKPFENHAYGHWAAYVGKSRAVPLKTVLSTTQYKIESTATAVNPMKLDEHFFDIPADAK